MMNMSDKDIKEGQKSQEKASKAEKQEKKKGDEGDLYNGYIDGAEEKQRHARHDEEGARHHARINAYERVAVVQLCHHHR